LSDLLLLRPFYKILNNLSMKRRTFTLAVFAAFLTFFNNSLQAQVGVGVATPDNSSMLEVQSTTSGFLTPRMTAAQRAAIASPATGLIVYQTDGTSGFYYNMGTPGSPNWVILLSGSVGVDQINATGRTSSNFLKGDGTWGTPSGGGGTFTGPTTTSGVNVALTNANQIYDIGTFTTTGPTIVTVTLVGTAATAARYTIITDNSDNLISCSYAATGAGLTGRVGATAVLPAAGTYKVKSLCVTASTVTINDWILSKAAF
jgi:hypothetical protein